MSEKKLDRTRNHLLKNGLCSLFSGADVSFALSSEQLGIPTETAEGYQLDRLFAVSARLRELLASNVPGGVHRFVKGSSHKIHLDDPN